MIRLLATTALGFLAALSRPIHAAAYYYPDSGTRCIARGCAIIASVDDLTALYHNPAALIRLEEPRVFASLTGVKQSVAFDRADEPGLTFDTVHNEAPWIAIPALGVSSTLGVPRTTFGVGLITPQAPDYAYPPDGPQRYILVDALWWQFGGVASVAHRVTDRISLGLGLQWWVLRIEERLKASSGIEGVEFSEDPARDLQVSLRACDRFTPSVNAGALVDPLPWMTLGVSVQPPIHFEAAGSLATDFTGHAWSGTLIDGEVFADDDVRVLMSVPLLVRGGVQVRPTKRTDLEFALVFEDWSTFDVVTVTDMDLVIRTQRSFLEEDAVVTDDVELVAGYQDAWSFRLGGAVDLSDRVTARLGTLYETSGVPRRTQGVGLVDGDKWGVGTGATVRLGPLDLDLAAAQQFVANRHIEDSLLKQLVLVVDPTHPESSKVTQGKTVGNGHFTSRLLYVSAALSWRFGTPTGTRG
ncbi:MAG: outer membrane protein transport protein [Deltaproteobacteria bacterium]|nr:outer membrane protein transport protein [Deltaproteobacteria bacterium]